MIFTKFWKEQFEEARLRLDSVSKRISELFARADHCDKVARELDLKERTLAAAHHRLTGRVSEAEALIRSHVQGQSDIGADFKYLDAKVAEIDTVVVELVRKLAALEKPKKAEDKPKTPRKPRENPKPPVRRSNKRKTT